MFAVTLKTTKMNYDKKFDFTTEEIVTIATTKGVGYEARTDLFDGTSRYDSLEELYDTYGGDLKNYAMTRVGLNLHGRDVWYWFTNQRYFTNFYNEPVEHLKFEHSYSCISGYVNKAYMAGYKARERMIKILATVR
jgi:hypothetical protein